jgi:4-hydroxyphenylpyruvate dioxygenase-like putative hemolysin
MDFVVVETPSMISKIDHVQLAMPAGREEDARAFYRGLFGIPEVSKPAHLAARGGCWLNAVTSRFISAPILPLSRRKKLTLVCTENSNPSIAVVQSTQDSVRT